jgi:aspartyl-tRNA(Asn)/glutamyl-tRNA(Gln) amidotransferase subunit C
MVGSMSGPAIDRARLEHIARLSALSLREDEMDQLARDLSAIVSYVDELTSLDLTDVPPTAHVQFEASPWRDDNVLPGLTHEQALSSAPQVEREGFAVPVFVGGAS